jgi:tRNA G46 methylase TrmB
MWRWQLFLVALLSCTGGRAQVSAFLVGNPAQALFSSGALSATVLSGLEVNPHDVLEETIYRQIEDWVHQRGEARWLGDYAAADAVREQLNDPSLLPAGLSLVLEDVPRSRGGGSHWSLEYVVSPEQISKAEPGPTVLQLAHAALGLAVSASQTRQDFEVERTRLVQQAKGRLAAWLGIQEKLKKGVSLVDCTSTDAERTALWWTVAQELRGRKSADAAFWFSMAGVSDPVLYDSLLDVSLQEVARFGYRPSCRTKDLWAVVDRLAAAGVPPTERAIKTFSAICSAREDRVMALDEIMSRWNLHTDSCALLVWKFSTRQRKQRDFLATAARHWQSQHSGTSEPAAASAPATREPPSYDWSQIFCDPHRPLVIDVGCGMGLSLLGLASLDDSHEWQNCNLLGVDLSSLAIGYARGLAHRWGLVSTLHFADDSAEHLLEAVLQSYPGPVRQVLIQFPTPYRLLPANGDDDYKGNTQLPKNTADGFMVSSGLLKQVASVLRKSRGTLLLQSNCEDVAVYMYQAAVQDANMKGVLSENPRRSMLSETTQRTQTWLAQQGTKVDRACGPVWCDAPVLPKVCRTETEVCCTLNKTPVHRCLLTAAEECNDS